MRWQLCDNSYLLSCSNYTGSVWSYPNTPHTPPPLGRRMVFPTSHTPHNSLRNTSEPPCWSRRPLVMPRSCTCPACRCSGSWPGPGARIVHMSPRTPSVSSCWFHSCPGVVCRVSIGNISMLTCNNNNFAEEQAHLFEGYCTSFRREGVSALVGVAQLTS